MASNTYNMTSNTFPELHHLRTLLEASSDIRSSEMLEDTDALGKRLDDITEYISILSDISETDDEAILDDLSERLPESERKLYKLPATTIPERRLLIIKGVLLPELMRIQTSGNHYKEV